MNIRKRSSLLLIEQASSTAWSFVLGTLMARIGGVDLFGTYAVILTVYFVLTSAVASMTVGIVSVDITRLSFSRIKYLHFSRLAAENLSIIISALGSVVIISFVITSHVHAPVVVAILGILYLFANMIADIRRRILALSNNVMHLTIASSLRTGALCLLAYISYLFFDKRFLLLSTAIGAVFLSFVHVLVLGRLTHQKYKKKDRLAEIAFGRQVRLGGWLFASSLSTSALEQGLVLLSGFHGTPKIAGGLRAGSYLFGFLRPLLQVAELVLPSSAFKYLGRNPNLNKILLFTLVGALISGMSAWCLGLANAYVWLPFLGHEYTDFSYVSFWYAAIFSCVMARAFLMPFLKARVPRSLFTSSVIGTLVGFAVVIYKQDFEIRTICMAVLASVSTQLLLNYLTLIYAYLPSVYHGKISTRVKSYLWREDV